MSLKPFIAAASACMAAVAFAQSAAPLDPDWQEMDAPPPPALRTTGLIPVEVRGSELTFGVDPASVSLGADRVVRYVVVAQSASGVVTGIYEGINCAGAQVKVFARYDPQKQAWVPQRDAEWKPIREGVHARYSYAIARQGACMGDGPNQSASTIVRDLQQSPDRRFRPEYR